MATPRLRQPSGGYGHAIAAHLSAAGFADLPRNGPFVLGGIDSDGGSAVELIRGLGVTRQAASQLIDTLGLRGYLSREINGSSSCCPRPRWLGSERGWPPWRR